MNKKIGFIGIGVMGSPIIGHLQAAGYEVFGYTRTKAKVESLIEAGLHWCADRESLVSQCDIIFTMVGFPTDVEDTYFGDTGVFAYAKPGQIFIDMTTSQPTLARRIAEAAIAVECTALDAPVTGSDLGAINGTLSMMVGGDKATFTTLFPILDIFTGTCIHVGDAGKGQHMKMANQIAICGNLIGVAEAFTYGNLMELDLEDVFTVLTGGSANSWQLANNGRKIIDNNFAPGFFLKHFAKDLTIAIDELEKMDHTLPMLSYGRSLCRDLVERGFGDDGSQRLIQAYDDML